MDHRIEKALLYIAKNFQGVITLQSLSDEAFLSPYHFHRIFCSAVGETPQQYVNKIRLEYAAHFLMLYPKSLLMEVAFESGFSSPSTFTRSFHQYFGISPSAYRKSKKMPSGVGGKAKIQPIQIPIKYFPQTTIKVKRVSLEGTVINTVYHELVRLHQHIGYGFYLDQPFHCPLEKCRHYVGSENVNMSFNQQMEIDSGYYTHLTIRGPFENMYDVVSNFKLNKIDPSGYEIKSLVGFERIKLPNNANAFNYFEAERELFIKVARK